ncbi:penicillin-binding protein 2 [Leptothermofonsia sichuanensis E412]|uniref:peptidoglycan D,D-transpeptidase FtsI family protein n=1 Tax=Leptothermofonsia sichuanensis TaxID=2917832 RepID=UPI001CA65903|nr:penicillin-binding protein 2 [Leptothermofonsia sichuanensis]QZZ19411.1 penicillin-binding protein 2 [Leptothermofonsia sichuanensis E412]
MGSPPRTLRSHRPRRLSSMMGRRASRSPVVSQAEPSSFRLFLVWGVLLASAGGLTLNLFRLQVVQAPELQKRAQEQQMVYLRPFVPRRQVIDRTGTVLALDRPVYTLFAHPKLFKQSKQEIADQLAPILNVPAAALVRKFDEDESGIRIRNSLSENIQDRITRLRLDGLELIQSQQRFYPQQDLTADVVGYVNDDQKGQAGIELSQQTVLERTAKEVILRRAGDGSFLPDHVPSGFLNLDALQLQLTVDTRLHRVALDALRQQVKKFSAKRGAVVVMDVRDGSLLSLVTAPSYDPNWYYKYPVERFKNWAITDLYEPGSTFKPINVAIALEDGSVKPNSYFLDEGQITVGGWPIQNYDFSTSGGRGTVSVTDIIKYSSNVGMVHIVQQIKPVAFYRWLKRLGIGETTGIDLPSESPGQFKDQDTFVNSAVERATTSFGQGFSLTPIQLAQLHSTLANGGKLVTPHVVRGLFDVSGQPYWKPKFPAPRTIFSRKTTQAVLSMMETVVTEGTGKSAEVPGYRIGGKTGTAQKANPYGGYLENAKITSFVGIFPIEAPRYVVVAVVDEPQGSDAFGSTVAAPIVKSVIEALVTLEEIPPSKKVTPTPSPSPEAEAAAEEP